MFFQPNNGTCNDSLARNAINNTVKQTYLELGLVLDDIRTMCSNSDIKHLKYCETSQSDTLQSVAV